MKLLSLDKLKGATFVGSTSNRCGDEMILVFELHDGTSLAYACIEAEGCEDDGGYLDERTYRDIDESRYDPEDLLKCGFYTREEYEARLKVDELALAVKLDEVKARRLAEYERLKKEFGDAT